MDKSNVLQFPTASPSAPTPAGATTKRKFRTRSAGTGNAVALRLAAGLLRRVGAGVVFFCRYVCFLTLYWIRIPFGALLHVLPVLAALAAVMLFFYHPEDPSQRHRPWILCAVTGVGSIGLLLAYDALMRFVNPSR